MAYQDCRDAFKALLADLTIDGAVKIRRVYADPPDTVTDYPCAIFFGSEGRAEYVFGGGSTPDESHTEEIRFFISEESGKRSYELVRLLRAAVLTAVRNDGGLGGHGWITELSWGSVSDYEYAGKKFAGFKLNVSFLVVSP